MAASVPEGKERDFVGIVVICSSAPKVFFSVIPCVLRPQICQLSSSNSQISFAPFIAGKPPAIVSPYAPASDGIRWVSLVTTVPERTGRLRGRTAKDAVL